MPYVKIKVEQRGCTRNTAKLEKSTLQEKLNAKDKKTPTLDKSCFFSFFLYSLLLGFPTQVILSFSFVAVRRIRSSPTLFAPVILSFS
jgi:hypothetical protein